MLEFIGTTILFNDTINKVVTAVDLSTETTSAGTGYSGILQFVSLGSKGATCGNIAMACFQGTTSPKRNVAGYVCTDDTNKTIIGH